MTAIFELQVAVVDLSTLTSTLILCGSVEREMAETAFGGTATDDGLLSLASRVSRKLDFIPPIDKLLNTGWAPSAEAQAEDEVMYSGEDLGELLDG